MQSIIPEETRIAMEVAARDRLDRLESLTEAQRLAALVYLACCDGETFDDIVEVTMDDGEDDPDTWRKAAPYCLLCGEDLGIFAGQGPDWRHFRGGPDSDGSFETFEVDHEPFAAWRTAGGDSAAA